MSYHICRTCGDELYYEEFYHKLVNGVIRLVSPDCRECFKIKERQTYTTAIYGSEKVLSQPGAFTDEIQKQQTHQFLRLMGWKYNEDNGVWYDDIKKDKNGNGIGVWSKMKKVNNHWHMFTEDTLPKLTQIKLQKNVLPLDKINEILFDYFVNSLTPAEITKKHNVSGQQIRAYIIYLFRQIDREKGLRIPRRKTVTTKEKLTGITSVEDLPIWKSRDIKFTKQVMREIQEDYFFNGLMLKEIAFKYSYLDQSTPSYIIRHTITLLSQHNEKKAKPQKGRRD
jgi:hypothetical protein